MNQLVKLFVALTFLCCVFATETKAQEKEPTRARVVLNKTAKAGVFVVGKTAKYSWKATKFTAGKVVKPAITTATPAVGKFAKDQTGRVVKRSFPVVKRLAITYLKFRFSP